MEHDERRERGQQVLQRLLGGVPAAPTALQPFMDITVEHLFGDIWSRPGLEVPERSMATVAVLAALGREQQLRVHLKGALNLGVEPKKLQELLIHVAHYAGWPTGMTGLAVLDEVLQARDAA